MRTDEETGQTLISGMGELHLEIIVDRMLREFKVDANVGRPQVAYRETVRQAVEKVEGRFVRQTGGRGQFGHVVIDIEPAPGGGFEFVNKVRGGNDPLGVHPRGRAGHRGGAGDGRLAGYPMVDVRVTLVDGSYHEVDSSEMAFKIAGSMALQGGRAQGEARPARADHGRRGRHPEEFMGDVIGDLTAAGAGSRAWSRAATRR